MHNLTVYQLHKQKWSVEGCGSAECAKARKIVFARGSIPCDVCFVGEAPGSSEDRIGQPFIGPAGKLIDEMVGDAFEGMDPMVRVCFTNLVGCIPRSDDGQYKLEPSKEQMEHCKPKLEEFLTIARPKLIVAVGKHSQKAFEQGYKHSTQIPMLCVECGRICRNTGAATGLGWVCDRGHKDTNRKPKVHNIIHPAAILRIEDPVSRQSTAERAVDALRRAWEELLEEQDVPR